MADCPNCGGLGYRREPNGEQLACDLCDGATAEAQSNAPVGPQPIFVDGEPLPGWTLERSGDYIVVNHKQRGAYVATRDDRIFASEVLHTLSSAILDAQARHAGDRALSRGTSRPDVLAGCVLHPATADLVLRFSNALAQKLQLAERKHGYTDGWTDRECVEQCRQQLAEHVTKGDPLDVAAFCAFLWHHGESTSITAAPAANEYVEAWTWFDSDGQYRLSRDEPPEGDAVFQLTPLVAGRGAGNA